MSDGRGSAPLRVFRLLCLVSAFFTAFSGALVLGLLVKGVGVDVDARWLWLGAPLLIVGIVTVEVWLVEALLGRRPGQRLSRAVLGLVTAAGVSAGIIPAELGERLPWRWRGVRPAARTSAWLYEDQHGVVRLAKTLDEVPPQFRRRAHPLE